ncbi:amino acid adenylation domain-containing protein [Micromonospora sp. WMMD964]|uniref:non-ribosomal peptide synthetase n=1 Tax=Micromonospora sp. WMMD964 TaxID=3016091 RepID=UPI002499F32C|nr:amino acid adenylation domain-containing protein [Micromonospora sp. WMMD964]WFE98625.1 amino acid adenylation domain-containing protein [Micromonospora sp. WMMD964]
MGVQSTGHWVPASATQRGMFVLNALAAGHAYNVPTVLLLRGDLKIDRLRWCATTLAGRHCLLRTTLHERDGEVWQRIGDRTEAAQAYEFVEESGADPVDRAIKHAKRRFDLAAGPLWRIVIVHDSSDPTRHALGVTFHHAIVDEVSAQIFGAELSALYEDPSSRLPEQVPSYAEYALEEAASGEHAAERGFWRRQLREASPLELPYRQVNRAAIDPFTGAQHVFHLDGAAAESLQRAATRHRTTPFVIACSAFGLALGRACSTGDVLIGSPVTARPEKYAQTLGIFSNTVPIRFRHKARDSVADVLARTRRTVFAALENAALPLDQILSVARLSQLPTAVPALQVAMFYNRTEFSGDWRFSGLSARPAEFGWDATGFDLSLNVARQGHGYRCDLTYNPLLLEATPIRTLAGLFRRALAHLCSAGADDLAEAPHGDSEVTPERQAAVPAPVESGRSSLATVPARFGDLVERFPERTAVETRTSAVTYAEFHRLARARAATLRGAGAGPGAVVGVCLQRDVELPLAVMAIWLSGAAALLLEPVEPPRRRAELLARAGAQFLVQDGPTVAAEVAATGVRLVDLQDGPTEPGRLPAQKLDDAAMVIFTSGSSGAPKGVVLTHANLADHVEHQLGPLLRMHDAGRPHRVAGVAAVSFDIFLSHLLASFALGNTLVLLSDEQRGSPSALVELNEDPATALTFYETTPRLMAVLVEAGLLGSAVPPSLVVIGGEVPSRTLWDSLAASSVPAYNTYGPTECTIDCTIGSVRELATPSTIGRAYGRNRIYLLNRAGLPVPPGFIGEICVSGPGVADGYLEADPADAQRFRTLPFAPGQRAYLTGDLARRQDGGALEFLGRRDDQVKIRGYRIELGEVEAALEAHPLVHSASVVVLDGVSLAALLVPEGPQPETDEATLLDIVAERLPAFMVPKWIRWATELPQLTSGKADRSAVASMLRLRLAEDGTPPATMAPLTAEEQTVADCMRGVLGDRHINAVTDFFDSGGNSILALTLLVRLEQATGVRLPLAHLIRHPTPAGVARLLRDAAVAEPGTPTLLRSGDPRRPAVLLVAPPTGTMLAYRDLVAAMPAGGSVFGLPWPAGPATPTLNDALRLVAGHLLETVAAPGWTVVGWSLACEGAHTLARLLHAGDERSVSLVLLDGRALDSADRQHLSELRRRAVSTGELAHSIGPEPRMGELLGSLGVGPEVIETIEPDEVRRMLPVWAQGLQQLASHDLGHHHGPALLLCAEDAGPGGLSAAEMAQTWRARTPAVVAMTTPGDHFSMLKGELAQRTASRISEWLVQLTAGGVAAR